MMARVRSVLVRRRGVSAAAMMAFAWASLGCGSGRLAVLEASPEGDLEALPTSFHIQFNHPIADPQHPGSAPRDLRLTLDPEVPGDVEFPTPTSLRYTFTAPLVPARTYEVRVDSGLRAADGRAVLRTAYRFAFRTPINRVVSASVLPPERSEPSLPAQRDLHHLDVRDRLRLELAYPARVAEIERLLTVHAELPGGGSEPVAASLQLAGSEQTDWVIVAPTTTWPLHSQIVITVAPGLRVALSDAGSETADEPQVLRAATYGPFAVVRGPECRGCRPPPSIVVEFATPVDCPAALPFVRTAPSHELRCVEPPADTAIRLVPDPPLLPFTTYTLRLRPGLADRFGQTLGQAVEIPFETGDPKPRYRAASLFGLAARGDDPAHVETVYEGETLEVSGTQLEFREAWHVLEKAGLARGLAAGDAASSDPPCEDAGEERCAESYARLPGELDTALQLPRATTTTIELPEPMAGEWRPARIPLEPYLENGGGFVVLALRLLDAQGKQLGAPVLRLVSVTGLGITARRSPTELLVLVTRLADAHPVEGVEVAVSPIDATGALGPPVGTLATGEDGVALFAADRLIPDGTGASRAARALAIMARAGDETTLLVAHADAGSALAPRRTLVGAVYTDRGLYEPGEEIHTRVVARLVGPQGPRSPASRELLLRLRAEAARDAALATEPMLLGPSGTGTATLTLPAWAPAGPCVLSAELGGESLETTLVVGIRRPTPLRLHLSTDAARYRPGETLRATLQASYTFGGHPSGLQGRWAVRERRLVFVSRRFLAARFGIDEPSGGRGPSVVSSGTGTLDSDGALRFDVPVRAPEESSRDGQPYDLLVSAEVEDRDGTVSRAERVATVAGSEVRVGIALPPGILRVGETTSVEAVVVTPADVPIADHQMSVAAVQPFAQGTPATPGSSQAEIIERFCTGRSDTDGMLRCTFASRRPGLLRLVATAEDAHGRESRAVLPLHVASAGATERIEMVADRARYRPGERAEFLVTPPFTPALVLLTLERERLLWYRVQPFDGPARLDVEIDASWAPGARLVATALGPWRLPAGATSSGAYGEEELPLVIALPDDSSLAVRMDLDRTVLAPGETVRARIRTQDHAGRPVRADVNVFAVEETTLGLTGHSIPDLPVSFHPIRPAGVAHLDSRRPAVTPASFEIVAPRAPVTPHPDTAGETIRRSGVPHGADPLVTWAGSLSTGDRGEATHAFTAPASYGRYRVLAAAVGDTAAGSAESSFAVDAPLGIEPVMPAFVRPGDRVATGVRLWNSEAEPRELTAAMETTDDRLFTIPADARTLRLEPGRMVVARWPMAVRDTAAGEGRIVFTARSGKHRRRLELPVVVERAAPRSFLYAAGAVEPGGRVVLDVGTPPGSPLVEVEVSLSATSLAAVPLLLEELAAYPHDILESQTARVLGLLAACAPGKERSLPARLCGRAEVLAAWLAALPRYRCRDGSYSQLPGCALGPDAALTTLVAEARREAGGQGATTVEPSDRTENRPADPANPDAPAPPPPLSAAAPRRDEGGLPPAEDLDTAAQTLRALATAAPADPRVVELARALVTQAAARPLRSPRDLGRVIQALGAAAGSTAAVGTKAAITVDGDPLVPDRRVGAGMETVELGRPREPSGGARKLDIANTGAGLLFYAVRQPRGYPVARAPQAPRGLQIRRAYVDRGGKPLRGPLRLGDVVQVVLSLRMAKPLAELVLDDPLAAGLEPLALDSLRIAGAMVHAQARRDHVEFHLRVLEKTSKRALELTYLVRAVVPGTFRIPAPRAEQKDRPEIGALGEEAVITIADADGP